MTGQAENYPVTQEEAMLAHSTQLTGEVAVRQMAQPAEQPRPLLRPPSRHVPMPLPPQPIWQRIGPLTNGVFGRQVS